MKSSYSMFASPSWEEEEWDQRNVVKVQSMMKKKKNMRYTKRHHLMKTKMISISKHRGRFDSDIHTNKIATSIITTNPKVSSTNQSGELSNDTSTKNVTKNDVVTMSIGRTSNITGSNHDAFAILSQWYYGNGDIDGISDISNVSKLNEESDSDITASSSSLAPSGDGSILGMEFVIARNK